MKKSKICSILSHSKDDYDDKTYKKHVSMKPIMKNYQNFKQNNSQCEPVGLGSDPAGMGKDHKKLDKIMGMWDGNWSKL